MNSLNRYKLNPCPVCGYKEVHFFDSHNHNDILCTLCGFTMTLDSRKPKQTLVDVWNNYPREDKEGRMATIEELEARSKELQDEINNLANQLAATRRQISDLTPEKEKKCYVCGVYREFKAEIAVDAIDEDDAWEEGMEEAHNISLSEYEITDKEPEVVVYGVMGE